MRLGVPSRARGDQSLRRMEGRQVRIARRVLGNARRENNPGARQAFPRLVEMAGSFGRHRSTPSRRISRISGVRSS